MRLYGLETSKTGLYGGYNECSYLFIDIGKFARFIHLEFEIINLNYNKNCLKIIISNK